LLRNIALVVIVVILSIGSYAAIRILTFRPQGTPLTKNVVWGVVTVNATSYRVYPFSIPSTATWSSVQGTFTVSGDSGNGIRVYIMNATELVNWQNGQAFSTYCSSEETTTGNIVADPPAGETYYLVFDNTFSATSKSVDAKVYVMYLID
jgi:hypothetical protein